MMTLKRQAASAAGADAGEAEGPPRKKAKKAPKKQRAPLPRNVKAFRAWRRAVPPAAGRSGRLAAALDLRSYDPVAAGP